MKRIRLSRCGIVAAAVATAFAIASCSAFPEVTRNTSSPPSSSIAPVLPSSASTPDASGAASSGQPTGPPTPTGKTTTTAQECSTPGTVEHVTLESSTQGAAGDYQVYLPPCYAMNSSARYPVVYLLHGSGHDDAYWLEVGIVGAADDAMKQGAVRPMIFVMPDGGAQFASGGGGVSFTTFLTDELIPNVDGSYHTIADRAERAIGGISLGGGLALSVAAGAPTLFTAVGGHSPAVRDPSDLAPALTTGGQRVWLDVGASDSLRGGSEDLAAQLKEAGAHVQFTMPEGGHVESYWQAHLPEYLDFYDQAFSGAQ